MPLLTTTNIANGAAPTSATSASFWSQMRQENKGAPSGAFTKVVSTKSNGVSTNGELQNGITSNGSSKKLKNGTLINDATTPKATQIHKTTATTLIELKTASSPAVQSPGNSMTFKRKQLAKVFADSESDDDIHLPLDFKDTRIRILETEVAAKDERVKALEGEVATKDTHVQELRAVAAKQELHTKELVAIADEKDRRTAVLESEVEQKSQLIQQLEDKIKVLQGQADASVSTGLESLPNQETPEVSTHTQSSLPQSVTRDVAYETQSQESESSVAASPINTTLPTAILSGTPAPRDNEEPVFSTPETLKTGSPVPKAPVIVFPQNNPKKGSAPSSRPTIPAPMAVLQVIDKITKGPWTATGHLPDVRNLSRSQREDLGRGPKVTIAVGGISCPVMPKKMLMQVSEVANDYFTKNPNAKVMPFPRGSMAGGALCEFAKWINDICTASKEFSVKIRFTNLTKDADTQNLAILQAARVLGMSTYVRHFTRHYCDEIRKAMLPLDTIARIEQFAADDDSVYECLVNNVAHHRSKNNIPDREEFEKFLIAHPRLATDLEKADEKIQGKREAGRVRGKREAFSSK